jgi:hemerythrin
MPLLTWINELSVNVKDLDSQHQKLFDLVNELHEAMRSGKGKEAVGSILNRLADYAKSHLFYEERLMQSLCYPGYSSQKLAHDALTKQVMEYITKHQGGKVTTVEIMNFLKDWLSKHIISVDKKYASFFNSKGVF